MALPLLQLRPSSRPALDDEVQESTEGLVGMLRKTQRKNRVSPAETTPGDYEAAEWKTAASNAQICPLPIELGGRMLRFRGRKDVTSKSMRYKLQFGTCKGVVVAVSLDGPAQFRAQLYSENSFRDDGMGAPLGTVFFAASLNPANQWQYFQKGEKPKNVEDEMLWEEWQGLVRTAMFTIVDFVKPGQRTTTPNAFEKVYDPNFKSRTLAKFLRGQYH